MADNLNYRQPGTETDVPMRTKEKGGVQVQVVKEESAAATVTNVAYSAADREILVANTSRSVASVFNGTDRTSYVKCGATAATSDDHTVALEPGDMYETPGGYTGAIHAIEAAGGAGKLRVTEFV